MKTIINKILGKGNTFALLANVSFSAFGFLSFLALIRLLPQEIFGSWVLFLSIVSIIDMLRVGLSGAAAIRLLAAKAHPESKIIGVAYKLNFKTTLFIILVMACIYIPVKIISPESMYLPILLFYPLLGIVNLPYSQALINAQGQSDFKRFFRIKILVGGSSFLALFASAVFFTPNIVVLIISLVIANLTASLVTMLANWDGHKHWRLSDKNIQGEMLQFGKFSAAGYIGSNLLRSADTFILSLAPFMGASAIATFALPLKFVEFVEIPLRSFTTTAFPKLSTAIKKSKTSFYHILGSYTFRTSILVLPVAIALWLFPVFFLKLLGGQTLPELATQQKILIMVSLYIIILPLDRFSGVALFAQNKPNYNFYKIILMLATNIIFDLIAIFIYKSLVMVITATLVFTIIGIVMGWYLILKNDIKTVFHRVIQHAREVGILKEVIQPLILRCCKNKTRQLTSTCSNQYCSNYSIYKYLE